MTLPIDDNGFLTPGWPTDAKGVALPVDDAWLKPRREHVRRVRNLLRLLRAARTPIRIKLCTPRRPHSQD